MIKAGPGMFFSGEEVGKSIQDYLDELENEDNWNDEDDWEEPKDIPKKNFAEAINDKESSKKTGYTASQVKTGAGNVTGQHQ